uniref:Heparan sulfate 2-O-sulfotransferase 1 n=1 Tax=Phallusia mammillata TaxID=59560 RepID=A0A6F9DFC6_9ASCI|nr:heparan sulfate 2-O-sulfotransferase 1-like [Phallusia mammillata]
MRIILMHKQFSLLLTIVFLAFIFIEWQISSLHNQHTGIITPKDIPGNKIRETTNKFLPVVLYNRIPKSGSTSFTNLVYDLSKQNEIYILHINTTGNKLTVSLADQISLAWNITHWDAVKPAFYHGHFYYYSFSSLGFQNPYYINILREPLDRLVSHYYFLRYGDDYRKGLSRKKQGDKTTFDQCIDRGEYDCQPKKLWLQIPMMCGQAAECLKIGSSWALAEAKKNVITQYTLVGVTERIDEFVEVLEAILPSMFRGMSKKYREGTKSHLRNTLHKEPLSEQGIAKMKNSKIYKMERELYDFTVNHFNFIKKQLTDTNGELVSNGFRYEKVYGPKGMIIK